MDACAFCQLFSAITSLMQVQMNDHLKKGHQEEHKHEGNFAPQISINKLAKDNFQYDLATDLKDEDSSFMMQRDVSDILDTKRKSYDDVVNYRLSNEDSSNSVKTDETKVEVSNSKLSEDFYLKYCPENNIIEEDSSKLLQTDEIEGENNFSDKQIEANNTTVSQDATTFNNKSIEEDKNETLLYLDLMIKHETEESDIHYNNTDKQLDLIKDTDGVDVKKDVKIQPMDKQFSKKHSCNICFKEYSGHSGLLAHKETHVDKRVKKYMCDECPKSFFTSGTLNKHKLRHYEISGNIHKPKMEKLYTCDECGLSFNANNNLKTHKLRKHSLVPQIKPHHCSKCVKSFLTGGELRKHERVHTGEKPFSCSKCSKRFQQSYGVKIHERTHTGEKPYQCETCSKQFSSQFKLIRHSRIHTGDKPYSCSECLASFSQSGNLKTHLKTCKISQANGGQLQV